MKKYTLFFIFTLCLLLSPAFVSPVEAAGLTTAQATSLIELVKASPNTPSSTFVSLITAFSKITTDQATTLIDLVKASPSTPTSNFVSVILTFSSDTGSSSNLTASLTVNGQTSVTNADPLASRTWAWSGTPGATYTASGNLTDCDTASQNGSQHNWTPWTDTGATGNATSGSSSIIPGAVKYGCTIVGTYNVTKNGQTTTGTATITYKHANGSVNTPPVVTGTPGVPQASFAVGEHPVPGQPPENDFPLGFSGDANVSCKLVSGELPSGVEIKSRNDGYGCFIAGVVGGPVGVYKITWKGEGMSNGVFKSSTSNLEITVYVPDKTIRLLTKGFPVATVGVPYSAPLSVETTGNWTGSRISFELRWGLGGNPGGPLFSDQLGLWDIYNNGIQTITTPEPTNAQKTAVISGTPKTAGTYQLLYCAGNSTEHHAAFCKEDYMPFIVKPRIQTPADLNAAIVSAMNSLDWSAAHSVQSAASFKATMQQNGWTLGDVATATGRNESDLVNTLYPVAAGGDSRAPDALARYDTIRFLIQGYVQTFDWSAANKQQSAISFKALMDQKGWTRSNVQTAFPIYMGPQDPILTEILKAYDSGSAGSVSSKPSTPSPLTINGARTASGNTTDIITLTWTPSINSPTKYCMTIVGPGTNPVNNPPASININDNPTCALTQGLATSFTRSLASFGLGTGAYTFTMYACNASGCSTNSNEVQYVASAPNAVPHLTTLSPASGSVGTTVTINGSGFTGTNQIYLDSTPVDTLSTGGGSTPSWISFVVPTNLPSCPAWDRLCTPGPALTTGAHTIRVVNTNGTSGSLSFGVN